MFVNFCQKEVLVDISNVLLLGPKYFLPLGTITFF